MVEGLRLSMLDRQWQGAVVEMKLCDLHGVVGDEQVSDLWQKSQRLMDKSAMANYTIKLGSTIL